MKALVIAIDGADPDYVQSGIEQGLLPTISGLIENGIWSPLRSTMPPISSPAWITFRTGKDPGQLGLSGFFVKEEGTYEIRVADFKVPHLAVWEILSQHEMRVGVVNVHLTYPPDPVNGVMISPVYARSDDYYYPLDVRSAIEAQLGKLDYEVKDKEFFAQNVTEEHLRLEKNRSRLAKTVLTDYGPFDVFMCGFNLDRAHHVTTDEELLLELYQYADHIVREILDLANPDNVFIVSDHGSGPVRGSFFVNQWLSRQGFIKLENAPPITSSNLLSSRERISNILKGLGVLSLARRVVPRSVRNFVPARHLSYRQALPDIDWARTVAFSPFSGGIYLNLEGREPSGIVKPAQYETIQTEIVSGLKELQDPLTAEPLDIIVCRRQEIYAGPKASTLPDILFFAPHYSSRSAWARHVVEPGAGRPGDHRLEGIFMASGKDVQSDMEVASPQIADIAPTLLHLMEVPVADDMDGDVLEIFRTKRPPVYAHYTLPEPAYAEEEDQAQVIQRLRALGYID